MKVAYLAKEAWEKDFIAARLPAADLQFFAGPLGEHLGAMRPDTEALSVFVDSPVGAAELERLPGLRLIATRSTGFDHIDLAAARERGVAVASVPAYGAPTVAEFVFALILGLSRRLCEARRRVAEEGSFSREGLTGFDLMGKTLGVVGTGRIGAHVIKIAGGFGMQVLAYDPHPNAELAKSLGFSYAGLPELLAASDIITLHVPYSGQTHHLINASNIPLVKRGAYLINTARGPVVETDALVSALKEEILAGAGLDVLEEEGDMADEMHLLASGHPKESELRTILENHYLMQHPRVIVTPHVAFDTREAIERILSTTADNITAFFGGEPRNLVH